MQGRGSSVRRRALRLLLAAPVLALAAGTQAAAQEAGPPTFRATAGHGFGERITTHAEMMRYLERLAAVSPRVRLVIQGTSWEGRALPVAIVSAPENHARMEEIQEAARRLGDPRRTALEEAERLAREQPVVVWLGGSIHGNELSGAEGLLKLLDRLARAEDPETMRTLRESVVLVDPMLNPDGRDAFAHRNRRTAGPVPNPEREDWGNDANAWEGIGYRTGHYYFDTNRDWFAHTQRETRARLATLRAWRPQVVVDAHEMSPDVEFFFDPPTDPYAPTFPRFAREWFPRFGTAYAAAFDSAGFPYMTRERYNYFYPGYTTSYGSYQGAVGMLYEQGSSAGLAIRRPDHSVRTLSEALEHQYVAASTALRLAVAERERLLLDYHRAHREDVEAGSQGVRRYLVPPDGGDPGLVAEMAALLVRNGVEVGRLGDPIRLAPLRDRTGRPVEGRELPSGTLVVELAQPRGRLARALLSPEVPLPAEFVAEARARVDRDENPRFYDITAWSLPLLFDLEAYGTEDGRALRTEPVQAADDAPPEPPRRSVAFPAAAPRYAYLVDGRRAHALSVLDGALARGDRGAVLLRPTRVAGEAVPAGTVVIPVNSDRSERGGQHEALRDLAERFGVDVRGVDTGHGAADGPSLGSDDMLPVRRPTIGLVGEGAVHGYSFGWAWYTLAEQHGLPLTVLRAAGLEDRPLDGFDVLVLPHLTSAERFTDALGEAGKERLARWVRDGGTLVAIGSAVEVTRDDWALLDLRSWYATEEGEDAYRYTVPGAIVRAELDTLSWMAAGLPRPELPALVTSARLYLAPEGPPDAGRRVVARYAATDPLRLSGHAWPESEARLPGGVLVYEQRVGRGRVVAFAEDPNFRGYWRGANRLFLNAVVLGPSAP